MDTHQVQWIWQQVPEQSSGRYSPWVMQNWRNTTIELQKAGVLSVGRQNVLQTENSRSHFAVPNYVSVHPPICIYKLTYHICPTLERHLQWAKDGSMDLEWRGIYWDSSLAQVAISLLIVQYTCCLQGLDNEVESFSGVLGGVLQDCCGDVTISSWLLELLTREEFAELHGELEFCLPSLDTEDSGELNRPTSISEMVLQIFVSIIVSLSVQHLLILPQWVLHPPGLKILNLKLGLQYQKFCRPSPYPWGA